MAVIAKRKALLSSPFHSSVNYLFLDSTNFSGFHKNSCEFRKFAFFWSDFERYNDLGICLWNPKQHRRSKKSGNVADSATNLILACCGLRLQCRECTVWPRNAIILTLETFGREICAITS